MRPRAWLFLTNDGDLAAKMLKQWDGLEQVYHVKIKGMLTLTDLDRLGKEIGIKMQTLRQPDASRGHVANYWYEVRAKGAEIGEVAEFDVFGSTIRWRR